MFINLKTGAPAYLVSHDQDGSVTYSLEAPGARPRHHTGVDGHHFFATHREATRDELDGITAATRPRPAAKPKPAPKARQAAKPKPAARKAHKAPAKPRKAPPAAATPPAGDKSPAGSAGPAGGEPGASAALEAGRQARAAQISAAKPGAAKPE